MLPAARCIYVLLAHVSFVYSTGFKLFVVALLCPECFVGSLCVADVDHVALSNANAEESQTQIVAFKLHSKLHAKVSI